MLSSGISELLAMIVVVMAAIVFIAWLTVRLRRPPFGPAQWLLYGLNYLIARILWRTEIHGEFPLPPGKGAVVVCNHRCPVDPSFIAVGVPRVIHWMVAKEYCDHPAFRRLLKTCEVIPVRRGAVDMAATRAAIRLLRRGQLVGVFPEARINATGQMLLACRPGAALLALKAHAPVVPCYIDGAPYDGTTLGCLLMPARVRVTIGQALDLSGGADGEDDRTVLHRAMRRLIRELAALGGHPEFEPKIAGRARRLVG